MKKYGENFYDFSPHFLSYIIPHFIYLGNFYAQHSTAQHSTAQHSTAQHSTAQLCH
nr:hypothetical protein [Haemophilus haemolyticus]